jgi:hypothetical protein
MAYQPGCFGEKLAIYRRLPGNIYLQISVF